MKAENVQTEYLFYLDDLAYDVAFDDETEVAVAMRAATRAHSVVNQYY